MNSTGEEDNGRSWEDKNSQGNIFGRRTWDVTGGSGGSNILEHVYGEVGDCEKE